MGVDCDAVFIYGYKVSYSDIPDAEERFDSEFSDIADEPDGWKVTIFGEKYWCEELVVGDDAYAEYEYQVWYIGPGLPESATIGELTEKCRELDPIARRMYELVMRKPPIEEPKLYTFARWY